jgi:Holliday junction resolvase
MARYGRIDQNQKEIVDGLRKAGASVALLSNAGGGIPDLLVGYDNKNFLIEVKSTVTNYGRNGLNKMQEEWHAKWKGHVSVVNTLEEAMKIVFPSSLIIKHPK